MTTTYKAMQAPAVPASPESKKRVVRVLLAISIALTLSYLFSSGGPINTWWNAKPPLPPVAALATAPVAEWTKLTVSANGTSERILLPFGMHHIMVSGNNYRLYTVYQDGTECSSFGKETCPDGSIAYYYIRNEMPIEDNILYTFVQK